jgi:hypothetical protein
MYAVNSINSPSMLHQGEKEKRNKCIGSEGEEKEKRSNLHSVKVVSEEWM